MNRVQFIHKCNTQIDCHGNPKKKVDLAGTLFRRKRSFWIVFQWIGASFCPLAPEEGADFKFFEICSIYGMVFAKTTT